MNAARAPIKPHGWQKRPSRAAATLPIALDVVLIAAALALYAFPPSAATVDRRFSRGFYPKLQPWLTGATNHVPFAVCDVLLIAVAIFVVFLWILRLRGSKGHVLGALRRSALDTAGLAGLIYILFMGLWGLNYLRVPLARTLDYDEARVEETAVARLARETVQHLNEDAAAAHKEGWFGDLALRGRLEPSFHSALGSLGSVEPVLPWTTKVSFLDPYLGATGISAFTNPFGLEVVANTALLPLEKPFTVAHEWAHVAGYADESEANFIAILACATSRDPMIRYSGWLALYLYRPADAASLARGTSSSATREPGPPPRVAAATPETRSENTRLAPQVAADLRAIDERIHRRLKPGISHVETRIYDRFLKANRVRAGVRSYGLFIKLLLGTRFDPAWVPRAVPQ